MPKSTHIHAVLIRSGMSEWDESGRLVGRADLPLAPEGLEAVGEASRGLDGVTLSSILHGPDQCSVATAEAYARVTAGKLREVADLADVDLGLWEGLLRGEVEEKFQKAYRRWIEDPGEVVVPEGEPIADAQARIVGGLSRTLEKLRQPDPGVGIVLRPIAYGLVRCWLLGRPVSELWALTASPATEWHEVARSRLKEARVSVGTGH
ncbi:MAG: histidine phosphatase family protein [Planctomycetota bacterium]